MHAVAEGRTAARAKTSKKRGLSNVRGGNGTASRTVGLLGAIFSYAVRRRMRADNPVRGVELFADGKRERRLSDAEYRMLGAALKKAAGEACLAGGRSRGPLPRAHRLALRRGAGATLEGGGPYRRTAILPTQKPAKSVRPLSTRGL